MLGGYWHGRHTDFDALDQALTVAEEVLRRTPARLLPAVIDYVTARPRADSPVADHQTRARPADVAPLTGAGTCAGRPTGTAPGAPGRGDQLDAAHAEPLAEVAQWAQAVSDATGRARDRRRGRKICWPPVRQLAMRGLR